MAEKCKYCEGELSVMDSVYIESEIRTAPKKVQNLIKSHHNLVCYMCYKKLKAIKVINTEDKNRDFKILRYGINRNQDLISKLERGAFSSQRYYVNPVSFKPSISVFKASDYLKKSGMSKLGAKPIDLPRIDDKSDKTLGDLPSRIFVGMLDVGTLEKDASDEGWNDPVKRNADPQRIHSQSMMRYNQIFTQVIEITIPLNTNLSAGSIMRCEFPQLSNVKRKQPDPCLLYTSPSPRD